MAAPALPEIKRTRNRRGPRMLQNEEGRNKIASRVVDMYRKDVDNRHDDRQMRLQRTAKRRQWTEGKDLPWPNASDVAIPDIMSQTLSVQDGLFNATVSTRPSVIAKPLAGSTDAGKKTDSLLDAQFFIESPGEHTLSDIIDEFVNEGVCQVYVPWIKEMRPTYDVPVFDPIPNAQLPREYFVTKLMERWPTTGGWNHFLENERDGWDWRVEKNGDLGDIPRHVSFYTRDDGKVEMVIQTEVVVHEGPRPINLTFDEIVVPVDSANLQAPSPSNPGGAAHVTMIRQITVDEIKRLHSSGFFDLVDEKKIDEMELMTESRDHKEVQDQKRTLQGQEQPSGEIDKTHTKLTLLTCFDVFDITDSGKNEDVVWWVIEEAKLLVRARRQSEMFPFAKPRRPFAEASFIPTPGFREGIGVPELIEGMHDLRKETMDLAMDAFTFDAFKFFFYRQTSSMNPEIMKLNPGEGYPLTDPTRDIVFPDKGNNNSATTAFNIMSMANAEQEKLTLVGDVQQGRVPPGRSSALRTSGGIAQLMEAGASRPERILRRFFIMLTDVYRMMHELNREFLPGKKQIKLLAPDENGNDVYDDITREDLEGVFDFEFVANQGNSSREAMSASMERLMGVYISELFVQMGIVTPENAYQMALDFGKSLGPPVDRYLTPPSPQSNEERITAPNAVLMITNNLKPRGIPMEAPEEHLAFLQQFTQDPESMANLTAPQQAALAAYMQEISERVRAAQEQQRLQEAAAQFQQGGGGGTPGPEAGPPAPPQQQLQPNELSDESLPSERGGVQ